METFNFIILILVLLTLSLFLFQMEVSTCWSLIQSRYTTASLWLTLVTSVPASYPITSSLSMFHQNKTACLSVGELLWLQCSFLLSFVFFFFNFLVELYLVKYFFLSRKTEVVTVLRIAYFQAQKQELNIALQNM